MSIATSLGFHRHLTFWWNGGCSKRESRKILPSDHLHSCCCSGDAINSLLVLHAAKQIRGFQGTPTRRVRDEPLTMFLVLSLEIYLLMNLASDDWQVFSEMVCNRS
jgi:hypothetical protein